MRSTILVKYFLIAAAIGLLYKKNASISGAEVGCQGEVGVASSMAAAGLTIVLKNEICATDSESIFEARNAKFRHVCNNLIRFPCQYGKVTG